MFSFTYALSSQSYCLKNTYTEQREWHGLSHAMYTFPNLKLKEDIRSVFWTATLKMTALQCSETSGSLTPTTQLVIQDNVNFQQHRGDNL